MTDVIQAALSPGAHKEDLRDLDARLKQMVKSLPATVVYNPLMTALALLPFVIAPGPFGSIPLGNLVAAIGIQVVTSVVARMVYVTNRHGGQDLKVLQHELMAFQVFYSAGCGAVGWLCWSDYNPVNNMYIALMMVCVIWAGAFTRAAHRKIFIAGTITTALGYWSRFAIAPGSTALALTLIGPMWIAYIIVMGGVARKRVDEMLAVRFANEDLTDALRLARDDALRKRFEAEAANASKTIFLANMSHELRTPLNAILGFSDIIAEQSFGPAIDRYREYARDIHTSGAHLLSLINDLLDVAKIEAGKMEIDPQPIEPGQLLENVRRLMAPRALAKGLALEFTLSPEVKNPVADPRALKQIILNLVSNSVKFTPHGGHISVDCGPATDGGFIVLVKDDGPGIPPEKLERVFKPFSQVDNRYDSNGGGTGLGLALVQGLAQLHGGRAWIESHVGAGTKVFVYFPMSDRFSKTAFRAAS